MGKAKIKNQTAPDTPDSGYTELYVDSADKHAKIKDDTGTVTDLTSASGAIQVTDVDAKGDLIVGTANDAVDNLPVGSANQIIIADSAETMGLKWINPEYSTYAINYQNANYTLLITDTIIIFYATTDVTLTLPLSTVFDNNGMMKEFGIGNVSSNGSVLNIVLSGSEEFVDGHAGMKVTKGNLVRLGGTYPTLGAGWFVLKSSPALVQYRRNATWNASSFASATAVPFDTVDLENDSYKLEANTTTTSRVDININGEMDCTYWLSIDSTGGSTYSVTAYLRVNGTTTIPGSTIRVGNYQNEDTAMCLGPIAYTFSSGDYIELVLDQNSLTGNVSNVTLSVKEIP